MTPCKYTVKDGETTFHYTFSQLRTFVTEGQTNGGTEWTIVKRKDNLITLRGYGNFRLTTFSCKHLEWINGTMPTDDQRLIPPKPMVFTQSIVMPRNEEFKPLRRNKV